MRGIWSRPFRYRKSTILLSFVEFDVTAGLSLGDLKVDAAFRKLCCRRQIGELVNDFGFFTVEAISLRVPAGVVARIYWW